MRKWMTKRALPVFLSITMVMSMNGVPVYAAVGSSGTGNVVSTGLCEHHTEHTEDCGYVEGQPCSHEHTEDCYRIVEECVHIHTEDCYPDDVEEATPSSAREPENCSHICDEDSGCIAMKLDCQHEHDDACGYVKAQPCGYVCEICADEESETMDTTDSDELEEDIFDTVMIASPSEAKAVAQTETAVNLLTVSQEDECICKEACTEDSINGNCPVCSAEGADLNKCQGTAIIQDETEVKTILSWEWADTENLTDDGALTISGNRENEAVALDDVTVLLPKEIQAEIEVTDADEADGQSETEGEETTDTSSEEQETLSPSETIELAEWICEKFEESVTEGEYTFTASLPEGYELAESAGALEVTVTIEAKTKDVASVTIDGVTTNYTDFTAAWTAATAADSATVTLLADVNLGSSVLRVEEGQNITLTSAKKADDEEYSLTATGSEDVFITVKGTFTLDGGNISYNYSGYSVSYGINVYGGSFTMTGGSVSNTRRSSCYAVCVNDNGSVDIRDGALSGGTYGMYVRKAAKAVSISGGTISGNTGLYIPYTNNDVIITGGSFSRVAYGNNDGPVVKDLLGSDCAYYDSNGTLITEGLDGAYLENVSVDVCTHSFNDSGKCVVCDTQTVASVEIDGSETAYYTTIESAWAAAKGNKNAVVTLLSNVEIESPLTVGEGDNITLTDASDDSSVKYSISGETGGFNGIINVSGGNLNIGNVRIQNESAQGYGIYVTGGNVGVSSGVISGTGSGSEGMRINGADAKVIISGGTISGTYGIRILDGYVYINDGKITGDTNGMYVFGGTAELSGGTFSSSNDGAIGADKISVKSLLKSGYAYQDAGEKWVTDSDIESSGSTSYLPKGTYTVTGAPIQSITISPSEKTITYGETFTLTATEEKGDGVTEDITYQWYLGDKVIEGATSNEYTPSKLNVGKYTYICVAVCDGYEITSNKAQVTVEKVTLKAEITGNTTKIYDETTNASGLSIRLDGIIGGDDVTAIATTYAYDSADAGNDKVITASDILLDGADAENYTLGNNAVTVRGVITKSTSVTAPADGEGYTINYSDETIAVEKGYEVSTAADGSGETVSGGSSILEYLGKTLYIRKAEDNNHFASEWTPFTLAARPDAPELVIGNETISGEQDGTLTVESGQEYKIGDGVWKGGPATEVGLSAGTIVTVRVEATDSAPHGKEAVGTVIAGAVIMLTENGKEVTDSTYTYTDSEIRPAVTVTVEGQTLTEGTDYNVTYADNIDAGKATVTVTGIGEYHFEKQYTFTIAQKALDTPTGLAWADSEGTVQWQAVDGAGYYEVQLCDSSGAPIGKAETVPASQESRMTCVLAVKAGETYTFTVKALPKEDDKNHDKGEEARCFEKFHIHAFGEPVWSWTEDYSGATAIFPCSGCDYTDSLNTTQIEIDKEESTSANCEENGKTVYHASVTFEEKTYTNTATQVLSAIGHNWNISVWNNDDTSHWHECLNENCPVTDNSQKDGYAVHASEEDGDCTTAVKCDACGYEMKEAEQNHSFTDYQFNNDATCTEDGTETAHCNHENCTITDIRTKADSKLGHDYKETVTAPTCTAQGYTTHTCTRCGNSYIDSYTDALGHSYDGWKQDKTQHWKTCTVCGQETERGNHVYDDNHDTTCNTCGWERTAIFTITFNANGGTVSQASAETTDGKLPSLPTPTRSDYSFSGWFLEADGGENVTTGTLFTADTTIYAHWTYAGSSSDSSDSGSSDSSSSGGGSSSSGSSSGGSSGGSSSGSSSGGSSSSTTSQGTTTTDSQKGQVNSVNGIVTGTTGSTENDGYSHWIQDENGWKLRYADGTYASGTVTEGAEEVIWEKINGSWYLFGADSYAKFGWHLDSRNGNWYYLDENTGMKTGWHQDPQDGHWYYLAEDGAMVTGWQYIDGWWYFLNDHTPEPTWVYDEEAQKWKYCEDAEHRPHGSMYRLEKTPDGYYVDENGAWDGKAAERQ